MRGASAPVPVIGLTGGIGAGKSEAARAFARRGAAVFSADEAVHGLYKDPEVREAVVERWGSDVLDDQGHVDRTAIAQRVFADKGELRWLEGLLHPLVAREWLRFVAAQQAVEPPPPAIVAEVPLLFEADLDSRYDATVAVGAPLEVRLQRVGDRATGESHARERARLQLSDQERAERADFSYVNDGSLDELQAFVDSVLAQLARRSD